VSSQPLRKRIKNDLIYLTALFFVKFLRILPRSLALAFMRGLSRLVFYLARTEREKTIRHLTWAFGREKKPDEIVKLARRVFRHFAGAAAEAIRLPGIINNGFEQLIQCKGEENLRQGLAEGHGVIILTGHFGNWELLGSWIAQHGYAMKVVGRTAYDPRLDRMIVAGRNQAGYINIARGKGTREIIRTLLQNQCLGLLIDQDTNVDGVFVDFFNRPAHTAIGPVVLAEKYGAAIIPSFIHILPDDTYQIEFQPALILEFTGDEKKDLVKNTQKCSDTIEWMVRQYPEQWVWMHERWKKKPVFDGTEHHHLKP
jgi:Kdo2-lipid IVA lauroyltransferase/acyltransferase